MTNSIRTILGAAALAIAVTPALAQTAAPADPHVGHDMAAAPAVAGAVPSGSDAAYAASAQKMHEGMMITYTGDADVDFVRGMIPHHQGAIDMAKIQLEFGKDPELRKLSEAVIAAQEKEIAEMKAWLEKHAPDAANADAAKMESLTANPVTGAPPASN